MKTVVVLFLAFTCAMSAYNSTMAINMAFVCADNFGTDAEIVNWTCKYCKFYNLTNVRVMLLRPRLIITPSWTSLGSQAFRQLILPLLSLLEAPSAYKIGSLIWTRLK